MTELSSAEIQERYRQVLERIGRAASVAGRDPAGIRLLAVTKGHSLETVEAVVAAGGRFFGENYVEEALEKITALGDSRVEWHMIGHVQSRKARHVCEYFDCVHSLDRLKVARRLDQFAGEMGKSFPVLVECNLSGEGTKSGYPLWDGSRWPEFVEEVASLLDFPNLEIRGLMTMPPYDPDPEASRPYFRKLRRLRAFLAEQFPQADWRELSMGMSNDFEVAVQEGATLVRVGTAIVGERI